MDIKNFYQNNDLILTTKEISILEQNFKNNNAILDWKKFIQPVEQILNKSKAVTDYYFNQFDSALGLQGGKILEIVIADTLAKMFHLIYNDTDCFYQGEQYDLFLTGEFGKGTGDVKDIKIYDKKNCINYIGEVKDTFSRVECDLKYDENGHLFPTPQNRSWNKNFQPILDSFNSTTTLFNIFGHNYKIDHFKQECLNIVYNYFQNTDFLFTIKEDKLVTVPIKQLTVDNNIFSIKGSEIRSSGKNTVKIFTPIYFQQIIKNLNEYISEDDEAYIMNASVLKERTGRGGGTSSKYNLFSGFKVKKDSVDFFDTDKCKIYKKGILQLNANISAHLHIDLNYQEIINMFVKGV